MIRKIIYSKRWSGYKRAIASFVYTLNQFGDYFRKYPHQQLAKPTWHLFHPTQSVEMRGFELLKLQFENF